jgi:hypothetical protein
MNVYWETIPRIDFPRQSPVRYASRLSQVIGEPTQISAQSHNAPGLYPDMNNIATETQLDMVLETAMAISAESDTLATIARLDAKWKEVE